MSCIAHERHLEALNVGRFTEKVIDTRSRGFGSAALVAYLFIFLSRQRLDVGYSCGKEVGGRKIPNRNEASRIGQHVTKIRNTWA